MSNNIRGITVELGGDTGPLSSALKGVNKTAGDLQTELKEVNRQLKFDPNNAVLANQKIDLLKQSTLNLEEKQKTLKTAVEQAHAAFEKGELGADKVRAVEREYEKVNSQLKDTKKALNEAQLESGTFTEKVKAKFSDLKNKIKDTFSAENIKTALGAVGTAAAAFLKGTIDSATTAQEKTETLSNLLQNQGMTADASKKTIDQFTSSITKMSSYSGGEAKDALQTLTEKGVSSGEALKNSTLLANIAAGSHKTLAESAGLLADAYNGKTKALTALGILTKDEAKQLGNSEDATISMTTVQERLNERFGGAAQAQLNTYAGKMKENTNEINSAKTAIGTALLPVLAQIADIAAKVLIPLASFIKQNPQLTAGILAVVAVIGILIGGLSLLTTVTGAFGITLDVAILPTIGLVLLAIAALAAAAILITKNWGAISAFFIKIWNEIKAATQSVANWFTGDFVNFFKNAWAGIQSTFSNVGSWFTSTFQGAKDGIQNAWSNAGNWFSGVGEKIKSGFNATISWVKDNWKSLALFIVNPIAGAASLLYNNNPAFKKWADDTMKTVKEGFTNGWNSVMNFFSTVGNGIANFFSPFLNNLKSIFLAIWKPIQDGLSQAWNGIKTAATAAWEMIKNVVLAPVLLLIDLVTGDFGKMKSDLDHIWINIQNAAKSFWTGLQMFFAGIGNAIVGAAKAYWEIVVNGFTNLWQKITTGAVNAWNGIILFFAQTWETIKTSTINAWNGFWTVIFTALDNIKNGIVNTWNSVIAWFQALPGTLWNIGSNMFLSMSKGVTSTVHTVSNSAKSGINTAIDWLKSLPGTLWNIGSNMFTSMRNGVTGTVHTVSDAVKSGIGSAIDWIKRIPSDALQWGRDIVDNIANGIKNAASKVGDAVKGVAQNIRSFLHFSVPDEGPLKDFESWMPDFMAGLADTMTANIDKVRGAAQKVAQSMAAAIPTDISAGYKVDAAVAAAYGNYGAAGSGKASGTGNYGESQNSAPVFNQTVNNYSPEALTPWEVARQTRDATRQMILKQR